MFLTKLLFFKLSYNPSSFRNLVKQFSATYKIRDEEFADEWAAFISASNISSEITSTSLDKFERNRQSVRFANQIKLYV